MQASQTGLKVAVIPARVAQVVANVRRAAVPGFDPDFSGIVHQLGCHRAKVIHSCQRSLFVTRLLHDSSGDPAPCQRVEGLEHVDRVIAGVNDSGKAGKVTLVLGIKASEEHRGALIAAAKVSSTVPKGDPSRADFFMEKGRITEDDPAQPPLIKTPRSLKPAPTVDEKQLEQKLAKAKPVVEVTEVPEDMIEDYDAALQVVSVEGAKASVSLLQRRMKIGYNRASELFELLKQRGAIK